MEQIIQIWDKPFVKALYAEAGEVFLVGGSVRDYFTKVAPKDIDLVVRLIPYDKLVQVLEQHGVVKTVGASFGVVKFIDHIEKVEYDIALPRSDTKDKSKKGHKSIIAQSDHKLDIFSDLVRRDYTMNAIAITVVDGQVKVIDPFSGREHIAEGIVKVVDEAAFPDDPLRMLRGPVFSARLRFELHEATLQMIRDNAHLIVEESGERVYGEFEKIFTKKGDVEWFATDLINSDLFEHIFGFEFNILSLRMFKYVKTLPEFLYVCCAGIVPNAGVWCQKKFKVTNDERDYITALQWVMERGRTQLEKRFDVFSAIELCPAILQSTFLKEYSETIQRFIDKRYPQVLKDLQIDGHELMARGLKGKQIGDAYITMLTAIFEDRVEYTEKEKLLQYV